MSLIAIAAARKIMTTPNAASRPKCVGAPVIAGSASANPPHTNRVAMPRRSTSDPMPVMNSPYIHHRSLSHPNPRILTLMSPPPVKGSPLLFKNQLNAPPSLARGAYKVVCRAQCAHVRRQQMCSSENTIPIGGGSSAKPRERS